MLIKNKKQLAFCLSVSLFLYGFVFVPSNCLAQQYAQATQSTNIDAVKYWFSQYDQIRRTAQMSPAERQKADQILGKGLALFMPGEDKLVAQKLLANLVKRYEIACHELGSLQIIPATEQLHRGYYQYFSDAHHLFSDYLKLQDDVLATDSATGQPLASGLIDRKQSLERLDQVNKSLDQQLRQQYGIPAYQY